MLKTKKWRNKKYLKWVKSLPCVVTKYASEDPHHITGHGMGGVGTKPSDLFTFPLSRFEHNRLHSNWKSWEKWYASQWVYVINTINLAISLEIITREFVLEEIHAQVINQDDLEMLLKEFEV